jgi:hypothetical protein
MIRKLSTLLVSILAPSVLAQEAPAPIKFELRMLSFSPDLQRAEVFIHDPLAKPGEEVKTSAIKSYLNHQFVQVEMRSRKFILSSEKDPKMAASAGALLAEVSMPEKVQSAILLFLPGAPQGKTVYRVLVVDDSKRAFPAGTFYMSNLSSLPIRMTLETKNYDFKPGQTGLLENLPMDESGQIKMRTFAMKDTGWYQAATSIWPHPDKARSVLVMFQDPASGDLKLRGFDDVPPREPAAAKPVAAAGN